MNLRISDYYMTAQLYEPPYFTEREFAIIKDGIMMRHFAFSTVQKLRAFLVEMAPEHIYFSGAKYSYPDCNDMVLKKKGFLGADLLFDIDLDKLKVPTLKEAKRQSLKLIRILHRNFGLEDLLWVFSGSRGYHVHCHDECIQQLRNPERHEIADYFQEFLPGRKHKDGTPLENPKHVQIDAPVTCDLARLMRLPGTIHGGSGQVCELLPLLKGKESLRTPDYKSEASLNMGAWG